MIPLNQNIYTYISIQVHTLYDHMNFKGVIGYKVHFTLHYHFTLSVTGQ